MWRCTPSFLASFVCLYSALLFWSPGIATGQTKRTASIQNAPSPLIVTPDGIGTACDGDSPCSLQTAQTKLRTLAPTMHSDLTVLLQGGTYELSKPLVLTAQDSGQNRHSIRWRAAPGERPVFSGAIQIHGWHRIDLSKNLWSAPVPPGVDSLQLFVNGVRAWRDRGYGCLSPNQCTYTPSGMKGVDPRIATWPDSTGLVAVFHVRWRDFHCPVASASGDALTMAEPCWQNTTVDSKYNHWSNASPIGHAFRGVEYFENAYELLGKPGQFYLDTHTHTLYYVPRAYEDLSTADVEMPIAQTLLNVTGTESAPVHDLAFTGIDFSYTTWLEPDTPDGYVGLQAGYIVTGLRHSLPDDGEGLTRIATAISVQHGLRVSFSHDMFSHLGAAGIVLAGGTHDSIVKNSTFTDLSGGAVFVGDIVGHPLEDRSKSGGNAIDRNWISNVALEYQDNVGIMAAFNDGLTIDHNTIEQVPYTGISAGWGWNYEGSTPTQRDIFITHNKLRDFMLSLYDGGAIYTQAQSPGSKICGNYIDFLDSTHGNGIYLDERSRGYGVHSNVVWNMTQHPLTNEGHWLSAWASWSGNLTITHNWTDDPRSKPHNAGPTKLFAANTMALTLLPKAARRIRTAAGRDAPAVDGSAPCASITN